MWLVGWWLVAGDWWLVTGDWCLVARNCGFADVVQRADVRMIQRRDRARFAIEPLAQAGILGGAARQDLDRDGPIEPCITRAIDLAHPAGADGGHDFVRPEATTGTNCHSLWLSTRILANAGEAARYNSPVTRARIEASLHDFFESHDAGIAAVYLFGSAGLDTLHESSDVDVGVLYRMEPAHTIEGGPLDLEGALERVLGRPVDLVSLNTAPVDPRPGTA
jgi:predicted nucleotidyltransferase